MPRLSAAAREQLWRERLNRFAQSDQTIAAFCASEGISSPSFYNWKRRLGLPKVKRRSNKNIGSPQSTFTELVVTKPAPPTPSAQVTLPGGIAIVLGHDETIARLVVDQVLRQALAPKQTEQRTC